jgi:signal-transduction protein with cAMP-binding, CBS, and nucleotidyltransferase domain
LRRRLQSNTIVGSRVPADVRLEKENKMLVSEILAIKGKVLFYVAANKTLVDAVEVMTEQDVGSLVVFDKGRMAGLLTFREVLVATKRPASIGSLCRSRMQCSRILWSQRRTWRWMSCAGRWWSTISAISRSWMMGF